MNLKDNTVLVLPSNIKEHVIEIIRKEDHLQDITFVTKKEFIKKTVFDYNNETIFYLMNKYNLKYDVAKVYIENMYYIDNKEYMSSKLNYLVNLKQELLENKLLQTDEYYKNYLNSKNIVVYGFDYIDKYFKKVLDNFNNVSIIKKEYKNYKINKVYEFSNIEKEVEYVAKSICELISNNICINNIKLVMNFSYNLIVEKIFSYYHIGVSISKTNIYSTHLGNKFINNLDKYEDVLKEIEKEDVDIYNKIINILNEYTWSNDYTKVKDMLVHDLKNTYIDKKRDNVVEQVSLKDNIISDEDYVFVLGFNKGEIPTIYKDEEYITDKVVDEVGLETTIEKNKLEKELTLNNLKSIKNLFLSYKISDLKTECYISNLYDSLNAEIIKEEINVSNYSNISNKIKLASDLDNLVNYGIKEEELELLYNSYDIDYQKFDNKYTKIDKNLFEKYINNKLLLSYSSLDNYNKCNFKYYLENILKISIYEDTFMASIGTIFHEVLSKMNDENFDLKISYKKAIEKLNKEFTIKEKFFLNKLENELEFIIDTIREHTKYTSLNNYLYEEKIYTNIPGNIKITFMGVVDKIMYKNENETTYLAVIDYKTGNPNINLNNIVYGLDMQLPIYLYLVKNTNKLSNVEVVGFYLQKILNEPPIKDYKHSYLKLKTDSLKLQGYSNSDKETLEKFDNNYYDSNMIKSLKETKDGFYKYSKVLSSSDIDKITKIIEDKIKENAESISNRNFTINPKRQENDLIGCKFCKFNDICFKKEEDIVDIKKYKDLEFLKGEEDYE